jgi:hypothetical protein
MNRQQKKEYFRAWYAANRERESERNRCYREANRERESARKRVWYAAKRAVEISTGVRALKRFTYQGHKIAIYCCGLFTAEIDGMGWSLNTFAPKTLAEAVAGAKHIIDNPPRWPVAIH